jgi:poly-gamma-glutamate synthesis protein (capsule biosynthesis protein)
VAIGFWLLAFGYWPTANCQKLTVTMTGDILLDRGVRKVVEKQGVDQLFSAAIDSVLQASDVVVGNLECPATKIKAPVFKKYIFRAEPEWLATMQRHGFTHLNLANNHSIDQGREGLLDTYQNILKAGMTPFGAGQNRQEAVQPVLLSETPRRVWLVASLQMALENYALLPDKPCVSQQSIDSLCQRVAQLRSADPQCYIIVSLHWGWENHVEVVPRQRYDAHQLIDAGADCLVCHHTHTRQPMETYRGKPVFYGLGNFIFDPQRDINRQGAIVRLTITDHDATAEEIPIYIRNCTPEILRK